MWLRLIAGTIDGSEFLEGRKQQRHEHPHLPPPHSEQKLRALQAVISIAGRATAPHSELEQLQTHQKEESLAEEAPPEPQIDFKGLNALITATICHL